ncbi:MAG: hypothetical protein ACLR8Y_18645 [Alistipes indistinctus]
MNRRFWKSPTKRSRSITAVQAPSCASTTTLSEPSVALDNKRLNSQLETAREQGSLSAGIRAELTDMLANAYEQHRQQSAKAPENGYIQHHAIRTRIRGEEADKPPVIATVEELQQRGYFAQRHRHPRTLQPRRGKDRETTARL